MTNDMKDAVDPHREEMDTLDLSRPGLLRGVSGRS